jgi:hypothetical protein
MVEGLDLVPVRGLSPELIFQTLSFLAKEPLAQCYVINLPGVIVAGLSGRPVILLEEARV